MEENILRYTAGYVCRKTREKLEASGDVNKDDMIFCLFSLSGDETTDSRTEDWTNLMDRGGVMARERHGIRFFLHFRDRASTTG